MSEWRQALMHRWWDWRPGKPLRVQNAFGRLVCVAAGHEKGRSDYCDWCGKDMTR